MSLWAIGDLHLSLSVDKPMDVFGDRWVDHHLRIAESWTSLVADDDWVLLPGDLSWAMNLEEALPDLGWLGDLPGRKVLIRGNHDYWWSSVSQVRRALPEGAYALQNDALDTGSYILAGTRGWRLPGADDYDEQTDSRYVHRELHRLGLSLAAAERLVDSTGNPLVVMMHYPPLIDGGPSVFTSAISEAGAALCVFGHVHSEEEPTGPTEWRVDGVEYRLVSADHARFRPVRIDLI